MNSINVISEISQNFLDSSLETNMNRAFPNILDGLKPGQRACIWEMYIKKYTSKKPHVKSAKVSGGVIADLWPHSDVAIYETFARMSQPFINNIPEIDWHGANGNPILGGDALANQRYTECRLAAITEDGMLQGINKNNVDMIPNFSEDAKWPKVLPSVFPRLLVNGAQGIGVSLSNTWLCHNFTETAQLIFDYIRTGIVDNDNYYPDFPTGGIIINKEDLPKINKTGKGKVIVESKYTINGNEINFSELPYQVYIEPVIDEIKKGIQEDKITGIQEIYNKSDKNRILLTIECENNYNPEQVVLQLFENTNLRKQYNANQNGIISKTPIMITLEQYLQEYVKHNLNCIKREFQYDLDETNEKIEILEGLVKALEDIDNIIQTIKQSKNTSEAKINLINKFNFTELQADAILKMRLSKLANMEKIAINNELQEKKEFALYCAGIVESTNKQKEILINRLEELVKKYGDKRRTQVIQKEIASKDKKKKEKIVKDVVITYDEKGYLQNIPISAYKKIGTKVNVLKMKSNELFLLFSSLGRIFKVRAEEVKECGNRDKGQAVGTILSLAPQEKILNIFNMGIDKKHPYIIFFTKYGLVKKSDKNIWTTTTQNKKGMKGISLKENDSIVGVFESNGDLAVVKSKTHIIKFEVESIRATKNGYGVKAISLDEDDIVEKVEIIPKNSIKYNNIKVQNRGGRGVLIHV